MTYEELVSELLATLPKTEEQMAGTDMEKLYNAQDALYWLKEMIDEEIDHRNTMEDLKGTVKAWLTRTGQQ